MPLPLSDCGPSNAWSFWAERVRLVRCRSASWNCSGCSGTLWASGPSSNPSSRLFATTATSANTVNFSRASPRSGESCSASLRDVVRRSSCFAGSVWGGAFSASLIAPRSALAFLRLAWTRSRLSAVTLRSRSARSLTSEARWLSDGRTAQHAAIAAALSATPAPPTRRSRTAARRRRNLGEQHIADAFPSSPGRLPATARRPCRASGSTADELDNAAVVAQQRAIQRRVKRPVRFRCRAEGQSAARHVIHQLRHAIALRLPGAVEIIHRARVLEHADQVADLLRVALGTDDF